MSAVQEIGTSYEGRTIYAAAISDNPELDEGEPEILYTGLHHAREGASGMAVMYYMYHLVENYGLDPEITALVNHRKMWFIPVVNPDGYEYNYEIAPNGGGMQRKNRHPECATSSLTGVDLNRNYGFNWGYDNSGSSNNSCSSTYRGTSAFSEPETQVIRDFVLDHDFKMILNYHTYGNYLIYPSGPTPYLPPPDEDYDIIQEYAIEMTRYNGYAHGTAMETVNYSANGDSDSYFYNELGIYAYTPELGGSGDGYWADSDRIVEIAEDHIHPNKFAAWVAGAKYEGSLSFDTDQFLPGHSYYMNLNFMNQGRSAGESPVYLNISAEGLDNFEFEPIEFAALDSREIVDLGDFWEVTIPEDLDNGATVTFTVSLTDDQNYDFSQEVEIITGTPMLLFSDDAESGLNHWNTNSWGVSGNAWEGDYGFTDSPAGDYPNLYVAYLTLNDPVDLTNMIAPYLQYQISWGIEEDWDFAQVFASSDGSTWQNLQGIHMSPGSGDGVQNELEFGYDGSSSWVSEFISLDGYAGVSELRLKFQMSSDNYVTDWGVAVDDIRLYGFQMDIPEGDINDDGQVNVLDAVYLVGLILGSLPEPTPFELEQGDLNDDGELNVLDIVALVGIIIEE